MCSIDSQSLKYIFNLAASYYTSISHEQEALDQLCSGRTGGCRRSRKYQTIRALLGLGLSGVYTITVELYI